MIDFIFTPGAEFLVAVQRRYRIDETVEAQGLKGRIVEPISREDYWAMWAFRGFNSEALSENPRFYYRCAKISDEPRLTTETSSGEPVRGSEV